jgi:glycosyltransferase involved in cell wall biosynthesis
MNVPIDARSPPVPGHGPVPLPACPDRATPAVKISIVTVCYNSAATIEATLRSIAAQTYVDFEHIVVDGGSVDGTLALVEGWKGHPVRVVPGPDRGMYDAMNKGVAIATGDVIGFLNADDRYADTQALAAIGNAMDDPAVDWCQGDLVFVDSKSRKVQRYWQGGEYKSRLFRLGWLPAHPTLYVRRAIVTAVGPFSLKYRVAADIEWMMRLLSRPGLHTIYIPRILVEMDAGGVSNAGLGAFLRANLDVWRACRALRIPGAPFVVGKMLRKLPQWLRRLRGARTGFHGS